MSDWNPPPPEEQHERSSTPADTESTDDRIAGTVFSKAWVLSLLVEAVKVVDSSVGESQTEGSSQRQEDGNAQCHGDDVKQAQNESERTNELLTDAVVCKESSNVKGADGDGGRGHDHVREVKEEGDGDDGDGSSGCNDSGDDGDGCGGDDSDCDGNVVSVNVFGACHVKELPSDLENDLCQLWDVSMNEDVANFLMDHHAVSLLLGVAQRSCYPRLTEISVGILGNMACQEGICLKGFSSWDVMAQILLQYNDLVLTLHSNSIFLFMKASDSLVLFETTRLIYTCISHKSVHQTWTEVIGELSFVKEDLMFILKSSTNENLLKNVAVLTDKLLESSEALLRSWISKDLFLALCEACGQTRLSSFDATCTFVMTMQLFSTLNEGIIIIVDCQKELYKVLSGFFMNLETLDHPTAIMSALSLLVVLHDNLASSPCTNLGSSLLKLKQLFESSIKGSGEVGSTQSHVGETNPESNLLDESNKTLFSQMIETIDELLDSIT